MRNQRTVSIISLIAFLAMLLIAFPVLSSCRNSRSSELISSADQLNDQKYTITVSTGSAAAAVIPNHFSNANITYNTSDSDAFMIVETGKADAYAHDRNTLEYAIASGGIKGLTVLDNAYGSIDISVGVNKRYSDELLPGINSFIKQLKDDGTLEEMRRRWVAEGNDKMPDIPEPESPDPDKVIKIGTAGLVTPMTYYGANNEITGFDVELIKRYAYYANVNVEIDVMGFDSIVAGLQTERLHMAFSNLNATEERREVIDFSDAYLYSEIVLMVKSDRVQKTGEIDSPEDINGKRIGYLTGASYYPRLKELYPDSELLGFDTFADIIQALKSGRIDVYFADDPIAKCHLKETGGLKIIGNPIIDDRYAFIVSDDNLVLRDMINDTIDKFEADGTIKSLQKKWIDGDGDPDLKFDESTPTPNGTIKIGACVDAIPFSYRAGQKLIGYEVELIYLICAELGYKPVIAEYEFEALLASIKSREDVIVGCITYTEERAETMMFTTETYVGGPIAVTLTMDEDNVGFFVSFKESFNRTFIEESRWKLIANGLLVTIELSVLSVLFGTILGFLFSFALKAKNKVAQKIANGISIIIDGLPLLVILMVLYYIIFAKTNLSAVLIGVIGFTLEFANGVAGMLNTGIMAVDKGQIEAAESMGYSKLMVFRKITFPQAANQMFGQYSSSIISLIKETSIIGYITVEDLTKAGDIIRSRTYEAFFPLFVTAIIYFIIARVFVFLLSRFAKKLDPKERKREVKGVITNDQY